MSTVTTVLEFESDPKSPVMQLNSNKRNTVMTVPLLQKVPLFKDFLPNFTPLFARIHGKFKTQKYPFSLDFDTCFRPKSKTAGTPSKNIQNLEWTPGVDCRQNPTPFPRFRGHRPKIYPYFFNFAILEEDMFLPLFPRIWERSCVHEHVLSCMTGPKSLHRTLFKTPE